MNFKYYKPRFEYEEILGDLSWPWSGHKNFGYDLVANLKPNKIVELGTHYGTSLWSFAQATKDFYLDTEINAIDTWKGEKHAGFYGEEVFETVNKIKDKYYSQLKINLIRKSFDEAIDSFKNNSIDILHIDGLHTYEAVKNDFEKWLPKMKEDGIILMHDIKVIENDFGVCQLWKELRKKYLTVEFYHSYGLGILFINKIFWEKIKTLEEDWQMHYSYIHETKRSQLIQAKDKEINNLNEILKQKNKIIHLITKIKRAIILRIKKIFMRFKNFFTKF